MFTRDNKARNNKLCEGQNGKRKFENQKLILNIYFKRK